MGYFMLSSKKPPLETSDLSDMINTKKGSVCYILGAGPSLFNINLSRIWDDVVIAVNSSIIVCPWKDNSDVSNRFWISNDSSVMDWDYFLNDVVKSSCTRIIRTSWWIHRSKFKNIPVRYFRIRDTKNDKPLSQYSVSKGLLGISSVVTAVDFAIMLGCKEINLLGVDHGFKGDKSHFWQFYPLSKQPKRFGSSIPNSKTEQKRVFEKNHECFLSLKDYADKNNCSIYRCSKESKLEMFPFKEFR